jgi:carbon storage regulator CsrA
LKAICLVLFLNYTKHILRTSDKSKYQGKSNLEDGSMLIIGREVGESVIIGDSIKVTIAQMGSKLHLAIDAPDSVTISRMRPSPSVVKQLKDRARKVGETVVIGETVKVTILHTESGLLRFAIDAPKEISVYREELCQNRKKPFSNCI